jgi:hypothetical protein
MRTRGDMLSFAIAFALRGARKLVRGLRHELTEEERYRVANDVVHRLKEHGDPGPRGLSFWQEQSCLRPCGAFAANQFQDDPNGGMTPKHPSTSSAFRGWLPFGQWLVRIGLDI